LSVHPPIDDSISLRLRFCKEFVIKGVRLFPKITRGASIRSYRGAHQRDASNGSAKRGQEEAYAKQK
jgi:hypothetical protein